MNRSQWSGGNREKAVAIVEIRSLWATSLLFGQYIESIEIWRNEVYYDYARKFIFFGESVCLKFPFKINHL